MKLEISLFRFNCKCDYLPYYTKHFINISTEKNLLELFKTLNQSQNFDFEDSLNSSIFVNGLAVDMSISIDELVSAFGKELTFEPLSTKRAYKDFLINDDDFYAKLEILKPLVSDHFKKLYGDYKKYYYASNTLKYEDEYMGDALVLLAYDIIREDSTDASLHLVVGAFDAYDKGIEYHTDLSNRVYNLDEEYFKKFNFIKEKLVVKAFDKIEGKKAIEFKTSSLDEIKHSFRDFNISYYRKEDSKETLDFIDSLECKFVDLASHKNDLGKALHKRDSEFTYKLCAEVLLDSFDSSVDFLVVDDKEDLYLLDSYQKEIECSCGRDINLPIIHIDEFRSLAYGAIDETKSSLDNHVVKVNFV